MQDYPASVSVSVSVYVYVYVYGFAYPTFSILWITPRILYYYIDLPKYVLGTHSLIAFIQRHRIPPQINIQF